MSKKSKPTNQNRLYRFCGNGEGVPGLPHEISEQEASEWGVLDLLTAAVLQGNYLEVDQPDERPEWLPEPDINQPKGE